MATSKEDVMMEETSIDDHQDDVKIVEIIDLVEDDDGSLVFEEHQSHDEASSFDEQEEDIELTSRDDEIRDHVEDQEKEGDSGQQGIVVTNEPKQKNVPVLHTLRRYSYSSDESNTDEIVSTEYEVEKDTNKSTTNSKTVVNQKKERKQRIIEENKRLKKESRERIKAQKAREGEEKRQRKLEKKQYKQLQSSEAKRNQAIQDEHKRIEKERKRKVDAQRRVQQAEENVIKSEARLRMQEETTKRKAAEQLRKAEADRINDEKAALIVARQKTEQRLTNLANTKT